MSSKIQLNYCCVCFSIHLFYDENSYRKLDVVYKQPLVAAPTARTKLA